MYVLRIMYYAYACRQILGNITIDLRSSRSDSRVMLIFVHGLLSNNFRSISITSFVTEKLRFSKAYTATKYFIYKKFQNVIVSTKKWSIYFKVITTVLTPLCMYFYYLQHAYYIQLRELNNKGARAKTMAQAIVLNI